MGSVPGKLEVVSNMQATSRQTLPDTHNISRSRANLRWNVYRAFSGSASANSVGFFSNVTTDEPHATNRASSSRFKQPPSCRWRRILLIVQQDYYHYPLTTSVNSAANFISAVHEMNQSDSRNLQIQWHLLVNQTRSVLLAKLRIFCQSVYIGDEVFIYYTGHGAMVWTCPCFVSVDNHTKNCLVHISDLLDFVFQRSPRFVLMVVDAMESYDVTTLTSLKRTQGLSVGAYNIVGDKVLIIQPCAPYVTSRLCAQGQRFLTTSARYLLRREQTREGLLSSSISGSSVAIGSAPLSPSDEDDDEDLGDDVAYSVAFNVAMRRLKLLDSPLYSHGSVSGVQLLDSTQSAFQLNARSNSEKACAKWSTTSGVCNSISQSHRCQQDAGGFDPWTWEKNSPGGPQERQISSQRHTTTMDHRQPSDIRTSVNRAFPEKSICPTEANALSKVLQAEPLRQLMEALSQVKLMTQDYPINHHSLEKHLASLQYDAQQNAFLPSSILSVLFFRALTDHSVSKVEDLLFYFRSASITSHGSPHILQPWIFKNFETYVLREA